MDAKPTYEDLLHQIKALETINRQQAGMITALKDVERRYHAMSQNAPLAMQKTLRASERRYRDLVQTIPNGVVEADLEGRVIFANPAYEQMMGYTLDELRQTYIWELTAETGDAKQRRAFVEIIKSDPPPPVPYVARNRTKSGDIIDVLVNWNYKTNDAGEIEGLIGVVSDITQHRKEQAALKQSEAFLSTLLDAVPMPVFYKDTKGVYLGVNRAFEHFFGKTRDRIVGKTVFDINNPEFARNFKKKDDALFKSGGEQFYEIRMQTAHGNLRDVIFHKAVFRDNKGKVAGLIGAILDLTERNQADRQLKESEERLANVLKGLPGGIFAYDLEGCVLFVNETACRLTGYERETLQQMRIADIDQASISRQDHRSLWRRLHVGELVTLESIHTRKDGSRYPVEIHLSAARMEGRPIIIAYAIDITRRKNVEQERNQLLAGYKQKAEEMEALFNGTRLLLEDESFESTARQLFDICRQVTGAQSGYVALLSDDGSENEVLFLEAGGMDCDVDPELPMPIRGLRSQAYEFGKAVYENDFASSHWMVYMPEGHVSLRNVLFAPLKDNGRVVGLIGLANKPGGFTDADARIVVALSELAAIALKQSVTRQALQEKEALLRQTQKLEAIGNLAGGIAHDFNNILFSIMGFTDLALEEAATGSRTEEYLHEVNVAAGRAKDLIKQILTFARQMDTVFRPVQVSVVAKEALKLLRSTISTSINIESDIQSDAPVMGDATQVHQIFMNLCANAAQAMAAKGGTLSIGICEKYLDESFTMHHSNMSPGDYLEICISDTGPGISPANMDRIFDPYFTTKESDQGTGLGLATVHGIVQSCKGIITVDSNIGKDTVFTIYLPVARTDDAGDHPVPLSDPLPTGTECILIVDDEAPLAKMMGQTLKNLGYHVTVQTSSPAALACFYDNPEGFDLVITDMNMPEMTGDRLAVAVMKHRPGMPVILCTGFSHKLTEKQAAALGIKAFIMKPVAKQNLARTVRRVLDGRYAS